MNILIAIIALSVLIIIHELGHFTVAKLVGIKVLEFGLFMGPKILSFKKGETVYTLRSIPIGGFVKMEGEEEASDDSRAFSKKSIRSRFAVITAGPVMNILLAILIFAMIAWVGGYATNSIHTFSKDSVLEQAGLQQGDTLLSYDGHRIYYPTDLYMFLYVSKGEAVRVEYSHNGFSREAIITPKMTPARQFQIGIKVKQATDGASTNIVEQVVSDTPADKAGFKAGDQVVRMNETMIANFDDLFNTVQKNGAAPMTVEIARSGQPNLILRDVTPVEITLAPSYDLGVSFIRGEPTFGGITGSAFKMAASIVRSTFYSIGWLVQGKASMKDVSGPVGIVTSIGQMVEEGTNFTEKLLNLLQISAFISLSLGIMNLLPIPALDGSKIVLLGIEKIRRKPLPPEKEAWISMVGFVLLMMLLIATLFNDIPKAFPKLFSP